MLYDDADLGNSIKDDPKYKTKLEITLQVKISLG